MAIDYFTRKLFAMSVSSKELFKIVKFLEKIYKGFQLKLIIFDNECELYIIEVKAWLKLKSVKKINSIPYYHQSNGKIKRENRTIRNACRKIPGSTKTKLVRIIKYFNATIYRGIGMSQYNAVKSKNTE